MNIIGKGLTFDDVLLVPQYSEIQSRLSVDAETTIMGLHLTVPVLSANMDSVTDYAMAKAMWYNGGLGILHRYATPFQILQWLEMAEKEGVKTIPSVGISDKDLEQGRELAEAAGFNVCVDVAHGHMDQVAKIVNKFSVRGITVLAGNVATYEGALMLAQAGADAIKVGIGPGSMCTTRIVTGHGVPQLTAIMEAVKVKQHYPEIKIIADGGIRNSGDIIKALAAGADAVMSGSLFAGCPEAPGEVVDGYKVYRGMASKDAQVGWRGSVNNNTPEGEATKVPVKPRVKQVIEELRGGIRSGLSYSGATNLRELQQKAKFIEVSPNCVIENGPHGKRT